MGGGSFDSGVYSSSAKSRAKSGVDDFEYSITADKIHADLDPKRINKKPYGKLESRDSTEHPESNAVLLCMDVTGSNIRRAREVQKKLPNLMTLLTHYLKDPQVAVAANDDFLAVHEKAFQMSDFESDNRIDEHIRKVMLVGIGGNNDGESYDLALYAAANKTVLDCFEKRGRKGYFFMYADEPIFKTTSPEHVKAIFGDKLTESIPIEATIAKLKKMYHVFVLWPSGGYDHAREQYVKLFGDECVVTLQQPALICEMMGSLIGMTEGKFNSEDDTVNDLVSVGGASTADAKAISKLLWGTGHRKIKVQPSASV